MSPAVRAQLLRARFRAIGGIPYVGSTPAKRKPTQPLQTGKKVYMPWPDIIPDTKRAPGWMRERNAPDVLTVTTKRARGASPLTKIAAKLERGATVWAKYR